MAMGYMQEVMRKRNLRIANLRSADLHFSSFGIASLNKKRLSTSGVSRYVVTLTFALLTATTCDCLQAEDLFGFRTRLRSGPPSGFDIQTEYRLNRSQPHPDFSLPAIYNVAETKPIRLSDYRGKKVLLLHFASWRSGCRQQIPAWEKATRRLVTKGKLVVLAITQEHHAERCQLFAQWKELGIPILHDQVNSLGVQSIPAAVLVDEHGIVQEPRARMSSIERLVTQGSPQPNHPAPRLIDEMTQLDWLAGYAKRQNTFQSLVALGDTLLRTGDPQQIDRAVDSYEQAIAQANLALATESDSIEKNSKDQLLSIHFRLGAAFRARMDSQFGQPGDFQRAMQHWLIAYRGKPQHEIWRRRIQQYGASLAKPYAFYDWVETANQEIVRRGQRPVVLQVALTKSEIQKPRSIATMHSEPSGREPDARGLREQDWAESIHWRATLVPSTSPRINATRIHLHLDSVDARWNNHGEPVRVWMQQPISGTLSSQLHVVPNQNRDQSDETKAVEFEFQCDDLTQSHLLEGHLVYDVIDKQSGLSKRLRQTISIMIPGSGSPKRETSDRSPFASSRELPFFK